MKRKPLNDLTSPLTGKSLSQHHPAAQITPFGSFGGETPRFRHTPGSDMRIAIRRPDGAWLFSNPHDPFSPYGVSEIDILPSPLSSTASLSSPVKSKGGGDSKSLRNLRSDYDHRYDSVLDLPLPPPAYGYDYSGYIPPFKN
ncbi:hypothetical protein H0H92_005929 [Tricholoma furcatifolium]|nr:hypothetical protein H0H92_005929 [Tricholoma furcatifolium]